MGIAADAGALTCSRQVVAELLRYSSVHLRGLAETYALLPETRCQRRALCCSLLPEMTLLEALGAIRLVAAMAPAIRMEVTRGFLRYFLLNPLEISSCPFLRGSDCLIYRERFFGCRAYGLWSPPHYEGEAARSRRAKELSRKQWAHLGVRLPREVVEFQVPYCPHVEVLDDGVVDDALLLAAQDRLEHLSRQLGPWHEVFRGSYFADLSFLMAGLAIGYTEAVRMKFSLVREVVATGNKTRIAEVLETIPDVCEGLG